MSESNQTMNMSGTTPTPDSGNTSIFASLFSGKNLIILILVVLVILSLIGINLLLWTGMIVGDVSTTLGPAFKDLLSTLGFTAGTLIKGSADVIADTTDLGVDIAKGTTYSIGDLLINSSSPGIDESKQVSLSEVIGVPKLQQVQNTPSQQTQPQPIQSSEPTVTPIGSQKPKAGWCYIGEFSGLRGCTEVTENDKCMSGMIFASKQACLNPDKTPVQE
jgi:hypothetical protein